MTPNPKPTFVVAETLAEAETYMRDLGIADFVEWTSWVATIVPRKICADTYLSITDVGNASKKLKQLYRDDALPNLVCTLEHYTPVQYPAHIPLMKPVPMITWHLYHAVWVQEGSTYRNIRAFG